MAVRDGDDRPYRRTEGGLEATPGGRPIRWLPRHGEPHCVIEWVSQTVVRALAYLPIYTAIIATITLLLVWITH